MHKIKMIMLTLLFSSSFAHSSEWRSEQRFTCPEELSDKEIFKLLMETEFAGVQMEGAYPGCLDQSNFPHISSTPDFAQDVNDQTYLLIKPESLSIKEMKRVDEFQKIYDVTFQIEGKRQGKDEYTTHEDTATILIHQSARVHSRSGCAAFLERSKSILIREECLPRD